MALLPTATEDKQLLGNAGAQSVAQILGSPPAGTDIYTGAALTGNAATSSQGRWQYSANGGRSWASLPTNLNLDGSAALLLSADTLIRFAPAADFNGTPGALNLRPLTQPNLPWITAAIPYGDQQGFIASWISDNQDGFGSGIYAQRFAADGSPIGAEFRVNSTTADSQYLPDLTQLSSGRFLITWQSHAQDGNSWGLYGQLYNPDGSTIGSEFRINTATNDQQIEPVIAALPDGSFVISWMSHAQDGSSWGVYAQRYDATGARAGSETLVSTTTSDQQHSPTIAVLTDGSYVIAFQGANHPGGSGWDIYAQRFSSTGTKLGGEIRLNDASLGYTQYEPAIAPLANGGYIVTWQDDGRDGHSWGIYARTFSADGTPDAPEFRVNTTTNDQQAEAEVAVLADGSFVITWQSNAQDGSSWGVYAQRFAASGTPIGSEFRVNTHTDQSQETPDITALADGGFVISWQSFHQDGSDWGVYGQRFAADGTRLGSEFRINAFTTWTQHQVNIASWGLPLQNLTSLGITNLADPVSLSIAVTPVNDRPQLTGTPTPLTGAAAGQAFYFSAADLLSGYTDVDADTLSIASVSLANTAAGSLNGNASSGWTFTPAANFTGTVDLTFSISDGTATVFDHTSFSIGSGSGGNGTDNNDVLIGTNEADNLSGLAGDDILDGMAADDILAGGTGSDQLRGGPGHDSLSGGDHDDILHGGSGNDDLSGDAGDDQLYGGRDNDVLSGASGGDVLSGEAGRDALKGGSGDDQLLGGEGDDFLYGEEGDDILQGGAGNDWLIGGPGSDEQRGGDGDDTFIAIGNTVGDDVFDGGDGTDTLVTGAQSSWGNGGPNNVDALLRSIERLELLPTPTADNFNHSSWDIDGYSQRGSRFSIDQLNTFSWIGGTSDASWRNELFSFSIRELSWDWPSNNWRWLRVAGEGSIDLTNPRWDTNTLYRIRTETGRQTLAGSENPDWFAAGDGNDILRGQAGNDILLGEAGNDRIEGGAGNDRLEGNAGVDTLYGGDGDDVLIGGGSNDNVYGEAGNDSVELNWGRIAVNGGWTDYWYDGNRTLTGIYDGGNSIDTLRVQYQGWDPKERGQELTIDLRGASITNFERLEIGTSAILRLTGSQYSQFSSGISKIAGYEGATNLAIDLTPGEELRFSRTAGINSASGALKITGTSASFADVLAINSDTTVDLSHPDTVISGVEKLQIQRGTVVLTAAQWNSFESIEAKGADAKRIILKDTNNLDLTKFSRSSDSNTSLELKLTVDQINAGPMALLASKFTNTKDSNALITVEGNGTIKTQDWPLSINFIAGQANFAPLSIDGDSGDNSFASRLLGPFRIDGKDGLDTFTLNDTTDLTQGDIKSIETLILNGHNLTLTSAQFNSFNKITGQGSINLRDEIAPDLKRLDPTGIIQLKHQSGASKNAVYYTFATRDSDFIDTEISLAVGPEATSSFFIFGLSGDDTLRGVFGDDQLAGGEGNDRLEGGSGFNRAIFSGAAKEYKWDYFGRELRVEHLYGGADGFDTLLDIQELVFADASVPVDDITNSYDIQSGVNSELGKRNRGTIDYNPSNDVWNRESDRDVWSLPLIADTDIEISKAVHDGSPDGGQVRFEGDFTMYPWEVQNTFSVSRTGVHELQVFGTEGVDYGISIRMVDDKSASSSTTAAFKDPKYLPKGSDPALADQVKGFIGFQNWGIGGLPTWDTTDQDWIRVDLVQGIQYEFNALGASSLPATGLSDSYLQQLIDPKLTLLDEQGHSVTVGQLGGQGKDPSLVYRAERTGAYYLAVESSSQLYTGAYTITRKSLDEYGGDINTNGELRLNAPQSGLINFEGDQDWFRISLSGGENLVLELLGASTNNGELHDPWLGVYSSTGQLLISDNNGGRGLDSRLSWAAPTAGTYFVAAGSLGSQGRGSYTMRASRKLDNAPDRLSSAFTYDLINPGTSLKGDIEVRGDHDWFQTVLQAGKTYSISVSAARSVTGDYDPLRDPALSLRDAAGRRISFDDDNGNGLNAELIFSPSSTGRYYLDVYDATDRYDGHYLVSIKESEDDFGNRIANAHRITFDSSQQLQGRINFRGDVDLFAFEIDANQVYKLDLRGLSSDGGSLGDPRFRLFSTDGTPIGGDDNSGVGNDASRYFFSDVTQTLYLEASASGELLGDYTLQLSKSNLPGDDYGSTSATSGSLTIGTSRSGMLMTHGDSDWFRIDLIGGEHYRFLLEGRDSGAGTLEDPYLELWDQTGRLLLDSDHGTLTRNAALGFRPESSGTYYVSARGSAGSDTGTYMLHAYAPDEAGAGFTNSLDLSLGIPLSAGIQSPDDVDWFRFRANEGDVFTVKVTPGRADAGGLPIAITELFDSTGAPLLSADGRFTDGSASFAFKANTSGSYFVATRGYRGRTGSYNVVLSSGNQADEAAENISSSRALSTGSPLNGALEINGDRDWYNVTVEAGHSYRFRLTSAYGSIQAPLADPSLRLLTAEGLELASNDNRDDGGLSLNSEIFYTANSTTTIYLDAGASGNRWQGTYTISATDLGDLSKDDHPDVISSSDPLVVQNGQPRAGVLESNDDRDLFRLNLEAEVNYQLLVRGEGSNGGTLADPQFRLLDSNGVVLAAAFDGIANSDASLSLRLQKSATYFLEVGADIGETNVGSYTVELVVDNNTSSVLGDDMPADRSTQTVLVAGSPLEGTIHQPGDVDWLKVELEANRVYVFDLEPRMDNTLGGWNPAMELIDDTGKRIAQNSDSGQGIASRIVIQPDINGNYYLAVRSQDGGHGKYDLSLRLLESSNSDPLVNQQWYLSNTNGLDLNLKQVWGEFSGANVRVGVIDDGINYAHPDLIDNLDLQRDGAEAFNFWGTLETHYDANLHLLPKPESGHGTAVTGLIGATRFNEKGIAGLAYEASVAGSEVDWSLPSINAGLRRQLNNSIGGMDISNNSWGFIHPFADDFDNPLLEPAAEAIERGVKEGRLLDGAYLGVNWVHAAGNARNQGDNTNYHNFGNSRYIINVASTTSDGSTSKFSTPGASILVSAFGENLLTTYYDFLNPTQSNNYTQFSGTSAAAPLVSGVIALMLEANPLLGYRDVQSILAYSARQETTEGFKFNGAKNWNGGGLHISHDQGFGLVDAHAAVRLAEAWSTKPLTAYNEQSLSWRPDDTGSIPDNNFKDLVFHAMVERELALEWAEVELDIRHPRIADLEVELVSPSGTVARLIDRPSVTSDNPGGSSGEYSSIPDRIIFTTSASLFRGESSVGEWTLRVRDRLSGETGELRQWGLKLYGAEASADDTFIFTDEFGELYDDSRSLLTDSLNSDDPEDSGYDTINAAAVTTASLINLNPGSTSRIALRNLTIDTGTWLDAAIGGDGNDVITGNSLGNRLIGGRGNDRFIASQGNDFVDGGQGYDQVIYNAYRTDFELIQIDGTWTLSDTRTNNSQNYGLDTLLNVERLVFNDEVIELNTSNRAPMAVGKLNDLAFRTDVIFSHILDSSVFQDLDVMASNGDSLGFTIAQNDGRSLPGWLKFNPATLELSGEPYAAVSGNYNLELTATDAFGASASLTFNLTIAGTSNEQSIPTTTPIVAWDLIIPEADNTNMGYTVGDTIIVTVAAADISDPIKSQSVFSAYTDLHYDPSMLRAVEIIYSNAFETFRSGTIDNNTGLIKDFGASMGNFRPVDDTTLAKIRFEVLSPGNAEVSLRPSTSAYLETTVFGLDGDQRAFSQYDSQQLSLSAPKPDLAVSKFSISQSKAQQGLVEINYELSNYGYANSEGFWVNLYLSDDKHIDLHRDSLVWRQYMKPDAITGLSSTRLLTSQVKLPRDILYGHALAEDPRNPSFGTLSSSTDWLFMQVEAESPQGDSLDSNNTRSDAITYFPWDIDGNGRVSMSDAIAMLNRIGPAPSSSDHTQIYDLNGDYHITQSEAMAVFERIGLLVNTTI